MLSIEEQFEEQIKKAKSVLIVAHKGRENLANGLALFLFLKKIGKEAELISDREAAVSEKISFLPAFGQMKNKADGLQKFVISLNTEKTKVEQIKYLKNEDRLDFVITPKGGFFSQSDISSKAGEFKHDLAIALGAEDLRSLGAIYAENPEFFYRVPVINIDNRAENEEFGKINIVNLAAASVAEIVFGLLKRINRELIDDDIATCLLAGLVIGTKNFTVPTVAPFTLERAADLISLGARRDEITNRLYRSKNLKTLKLWGRMLARLSDSLDGALVWSLISLADLEKTGAEFSDLEEIIEELISGVPNAGIFALFFEREISGKVITEAIIRSLKRINLLEVLRDFSPAGEERNIRFVLEKNLKETSEIVIKALEGRIKSFA